MQLVVQRNKNRFAKNSNALAADRSVRVRAELDALKGSLAKNPTWKPDVLIRVKINLPLRGRLLAESKMDQAAPITWLIAQINLIVSETAQGAAEIISGKIAPIVTVAFGIYIFLVTLSLLRGSGSESLVDLFKRALAMAVVLGLGLNTSNYTEIVMPIVTGLGADLATAINGGDANANSLDQLALHYLKILDEGYESANSSIFPLNVGPMILYGIKAILVIFGLTPLLVASTLAFVAADVGSQLVAAVGPLYFAFLLFPATRSWFSAWLNAVVSYALVPLFVSVVAAISITLSKKAFGDGLDDVTFKTVLLASLVNLVLVALVWQVVSLASSLSAGGASFGQQGGVGGLARSIRGGITGSSREVVGMIGAGKAGLSMARSAKERLSNAGNNMKKVA